MNPDPGRIHVAAAAIFDDQRRVLLSKRPVHVHQGGLWEFPGGKLEEGESIEAGLRRELREELGITPAHARPLIRIAHDYPDKSVLLDVWRVERISGVPRGLEGQQIQWVPVDQLRSYRFPAANLPIIKAVSLPEYYLITPEPDREAARFLADLELSLSNGVSLLQLRARQLSDNDYRALIPEVLQRCRQANARLLLNADPKLASEFGADGVHLTSERLMALTVRPLNDTYLVAASCHTLIELEHAVKLGLDCVVVSPVRTTSSHPGARTLGFSGFYDFTERSSIPVYALGGMRVMDLPTAFRSGGQGIAAISGLWDQTLPVQVG
ncbi:MAG: Nudix family hydrolase [Pseudomonadota bacterium]